MTDERDLILGTIVDLETLLRRRQEELDALEAELVRHHTEVRGLNGRLTHWRERLAQLDAQTAQPPQAQRLIRDQALEALTRGSMTLAALARLLGVPNSTLRYHVTALRKEGKVKFDGELFSLGAEEPETEAEPKPETKPEPKPTLLNQWDKDRVLELLREVEGGLSAKEIADTLGLDRQQVSLILEKLHGEVLVMRAGQKWQYLPQGVDLPPAVVSGPGPQLEAAAEEEPETPLDVETPIRQRNGDAREEALAYLRNCREASSEQIAVALGAGRAGTVEAVALMRQLEKEGLVKRNAKHASWSVTEEGKEDGRGIPTD